MRMTLPPAARNQHLMERRSQYWRSAVVEPAQTYGPHVVASNYQRHQSRAGDSCAPNTNGLLDCLGGRGAVGCDLCRLAPGDTIILHCR